MLPTQALPTDTHLQPTKAVTGDFARFLHVLVYPICLQVWLAFAVLLEIILVALVRLTLNTLVVVYVNQSLAFLTVIQLTNGAPHSSEKPLDTLF